ncbi:MAG: hypothetical protein P4L84_10915 [Isosphaeraceae bacterium]|nr:hypothetical protein [Isosphaeraceae bacterium]
MKRTGLAILLISAIAAQGCGVGDPGQPPVGSISVKSKSDDGPKFPTKQRNKAAKAK